MEISQVRGNPCFLSEKGDFPFASYFNFDAFFIKVKKNGVTVLSQRPYHATCKLGTKNAKTLSLRFWPNSSRGKGIYRSLKFNFIQLIALSKDPLQISMRQGVLPLQPT